MAGGHEINLYYPEAAGGTFTVKLHGTGTLATVFSDYDCLVTTASRSISALGRAKCFAKALVDVEVFDFAGVSVATRVFDASRAEHVAVQSTSFTGTLDGGGTGVGGSIYLKSLLDKWLTSAGGLDFEVQETGTPSAVPLKTALANLRSNNANVFNVKSPPYNAVGDGITNDDVAVQAAKTALLANGGGVLYFPAGTYLLSQTIVLLNPNGCVIAGEVRGATRILSTNGSAAVSMVAGQEAGVKDITIETTSAVAKAINSDQVVELIIDNVEVSRSAGTTELVSVTDCDTGTIRNTLLTSTLGRGLVVSGTFVSLNITDCRFSGPPIQATGGVNLNLSMTGNRMFHTGLGSMVLLTSVAATSRVTVTGNTISHAAGTAGLVELVASLAATITESGNVVVDNSGFAIDPIRLPAGASTGHITSLSRRPAVALSSGTSGAPRVGVGMTTVTATGNFTVSAPDNINAATLAPVFNGAECAMQIHNSTGGNITITLNAAYHGTVGNLASGASRIYRWRYSGTGTITGWIQQGAFVDVT